MKDKVLRNTCFILGIMAIWIVFIIAIHDIKMSEIVTQQERKIEKYQLYYNCTETMLDSLYVLGDNNIFLTPVGQCYLDAKYKVEENDSTESD